MAEGGGLLNGNLPLGNLQFSRKSFTPYHFPDRARWLLLALEARFWRLAGTIVGTGSEAQRIRWNKTVLLGHRASSGQSRMIALSFSPCCVPTTKV